MLTIFSHAALGQRDIVILARVYATSSPIHLAAYGWFVCVIV